jgi:hypothetical protein
MLTKQGKPGIGMAEFSFVDNVPPGSAMAFAAIPVEPAFVV